MVTVLSGLRRRGGDGKMAPRGDTGDPHAETACRLDGRGCRPARSDRGGSRDDEELRQNKALLVLIAVLILPVSVVWGSLYLAFGSPVGVVPFVYFTVSLGSLVVFARTRRLPPLARHAAPRHPAHDDGRADARRRVPSVRRGRAVGHPGSARSPRLPRGASGRALVRRVRRRLPAPGPRRRGAVPGRGRPGRVHEHDAGVEHHRRLLGRLHAPRLVRPSAQRGARGTPSRAAEVGGPPREHPAAPDRRATEGRRPRRSPTTSTRPDPVRRRRGLHPALAAPPAGRGGRHPRSPLLPLRRARRAARAREDQDDRRLLHGGRRRAGSAPGPRAHGRAPGAGHARRGCDLGGGRPVRASSCGSASTPVRSLPG